MFDEQKPDEQHLAPELVALERQLLGLTPALPRIDRDRLMFEAGRAAELVIDEPSSNPSLKGGRKIAATLRVAGVGNWFWPAATATMTAASLFLGTMLVWQNRSQMVVQQSAKPQAEVVLTNAPRDGDAQNFDQLASRDVWSRTPPTSGYLGVRYIALTRGIGALPSEFPTAGGNQNMSTDYQRAKPATARAMLQELLPASTQSI